MLRLRTLAVAPLAFALLGSSGCGLITKDFDGEIKVDFRIDEDTKDDYADQFTFDRNENPDVKENIDKIEEGSGAIRRVSIEIVSVATNPADNVATYAWGSAFARAHSDAPFTPNDADVIGAFAAVPLVDRQVFQLDLSPATRQKIVDLVFDPASDGKIDMLVDGHADAAPIDFNGRVIFEIEFSAGL